MTTCSKNFDRLLQAACLGLVGMLAVAGCGGSSSNPSVDASRAPDGNGIIPGHDGGPQAGTLSIDKVSVPFGSVDVGAISTTQVITVTNSGTQPVAIVPSITGSNEFNITDTCASVPAASSCSISVVFQPTAVGKVSGVLSISSTLAVSLSGTGVAQGSFSVPGVDLGSKVATGASVTGAVTVTATVAVTDLACSVSGSDLTADAAKVCPAALAANASCTVGFTFKATSSGSKTDSVVCSAAGSTKTALVTATVLDPAKLVISPTSTTFQTPNTTQSDPVAFGVANTGGLPTGPISATLTGTNADQFAISTPGCLTPLAGSANCSLQVVCKPTTVGTKSASLQIADSSGAATSVTAALTCVSVGPATLTVTGTANLGSVLLGSTGTAQTFTVKNTGTTASGALALAVTDPEFVMSADTCTGISLAAAGTCTVNVALKPAAAGALTAVLSVSAPSGNPGSIQLSGIGLPPGALTVSPSSYDFGSISVKAVSADTTFTVTNSGGAATGPLTVSAPGNGFVVAGNGCAAGLAPAKTCAVAVHFAPTVVGNATGTVTIGDGTVSGTLTVHGTGTAAALLTIDPPTTCAGAEPLPSSPHAYDPNAVCPGSAWEFKATVIGLTNGAAPNGSGGNNGVTFTVTSDPSSPSDTGALTVTTTGDAKADFVIASTTCAAALAPGASCQVTVNFTPTAAGTRVAILQVTTAKGGTAGANLNAIGMPFIEILPCSNADGSNVTVLTGVCTPLDSTNGTNFGQVPVGVLDPNDIHNQEKVFVVRVRGASASPYSNTLTVGVTTPTAPADFRINTDPLKTTCNSSALTVSSGVQQCLVYLDFYPQTTTGDKTGTLTITGSNGGTASVNVSGTATGPLTITPAPVNFGTVNVGSVATTMTITTAGSDAGQLIVNAQKVTVTNFGTTAQGPLSFAVTGANAAEFELVDDNCSGATLAAAGTGTCTLSYLMIPTTAGAKSATLTVTSGTLTSTVQFIGNAGTATTIAVTPLTNDFGQVAATAESAFLTVTVSAVGTAQTGTILYSIPTSTYSADFEEATGTDVGTCGASNGTIGTQSLGGSNPASCTIKVRFHPASMAGAETATLRITDATSGQLVSVALKGTSTSQITITPASQDFGSVAASGTSSLFTFTVANTGLSTATPTLVFANLPSPFVPAVFNTNSTSTTCSSASGSLLAGGTCVVVLSLNPAPSGTGLVSSTLTIGGAQSALTATIVPKAQLQIVGFNHGQDPNDVVIAGPYGNTVNFGTVPQGQSSSNVTIWYKNAGGVTTTALTYLWTDTANAGVLLQGAPDPFFPFPTDTSGTSCIGSAGLAPKGLCQVTFHLAAGAATHQYLATFELSASNAGAVDAITAVGERAASSGAPYITPSFFNFSATAPTPVTSPTKTSTAAQTFQVFGPVTSALTLTSSNSDFVVAPGTGASPCVVGSTTQLAAAGSSCTFTVAFAPGGTAPPGGDKYRLGTVTVATGVMAGFIGQVQQPATLTIGSAAGGNNFGNVIITSPATPVTKTLTITNTGDVASSVLTLQTAALDDPNTLDPNGASDAGLFSVSADCNKAIAAGATCSFTVTLTPPTTPQAIPSGAGYNVLVEATTTSGTTTTRAATSDPADPLIANVMNASALQILPTQSSNTAQFGSQPVGTAGAATTFTIKNSNLGVSTHASGVLTIQLAGGLTSNYTLNTSVSPATCGTYMATGSTGLASGATCLVTVAFNPAVTATLGALTDTLTVTAANDGATASLKLNGTAIGALAFVANSTPPTASALFTDLATSPTDFGTLPIVTSPNVFAVTAHQVVQLWVENAVGAPATGLLSTSLTGSSFRLIWDNCTGERLGYTNGGSEFCDLGVRFEPSASGAATGSVTVSGTPGNSATMALTGTGS